MQKKICLSLAVLLLFSGCGVFNTPEQRLLLARESFNATLKVLVVKREAGEFTKKDSVLYTAAIKSTQASLDTWQASLDTGIAPSLAETSATASLSILKDKVDE